MIVIPLVSRKDGIVFCRCVDEVVHSEIDIISEMTESSSDALIWKAHVHEYSNFRRICVIPPDVAQDV